MKNMCFSRMICEWIEVVELSKNISVYYSIEHTQEKIEIYFSFLPRPFNKKMKHVLSAKYHSAVTLPSRNTRFVSFQRRLIGEWSCEQRLLSIPVSKFLSVWKQACTQPMFIFIIARCQPIKRNRNIKIYRRFSIRKCDTLSFTGVPVSMWHRGRIRPGYKQGWLNISVLVSTNLRVSTFSVHSGISASA